MKIDPTSFRRRGFTLVELLTVVAIIGILAAILIPVVGGAKKAALKAKSRATFVQWASALESYKSEYGYYPQIGELKTSSGPIDLSTYNDEFIKALSGRDRAGARLGDEDRSKFNRKNIGFYTFGQEAFSQKDGTTLVDAFENPKIYIMVDQDGDGLIKLPDDVPDNAQPESGDLMLHAKVAIWVTEEEKSVENPESIWSW